LTSPKDPLPKFTFKKVEKSVSKERQSKCTFINSQKLKESKPSQAQSPEESAENNE